MSGPVSRLAALAIAARPRRQRPDLDPGEAGADAIPGRARPRVLIAGPGPRSAGGVWRVIETLTASPLGEQFDLRHIATHRDGSRLTKLAVGAAGIARIGRQLATGQADLVWIHVASGFSFRRKTAVLMLARLFRVPAVLHVHGGELHIWYRRVTAPERAIVRAALRAADLVIALGPTWQARLAEIADCRTAAITNPVALPAAVAEEGRIPGRVVGLGRLGDLKGSRVLVRALARLRGQGVDATLELAGDGDHAGVRREAERLDVSEAVTLHTWLNGDEVAQLLDRGSVFALPSRLEGLPMALLEAMAHGLPVVATPVGGIPDLVRDGEHGHLVRPDDPEGLGEAIGSLLRDPERARELGRAGRREVEGHCAVPVVADQLAREFRRCIAARPPRRALIRRG